MAVPLVPILTIGAELISRMFPDPKEKAKAEALLQQVHMQGHLAEIEVKLSAIMMEAKSNDKWTSRARPAFMYVIYLFILASLPFGVLFAFRPEEALAVTNGVQSWLAAIPGELWGLFGAGYLGYTGARSYDKKKILDLRKGL